MEWTSLSTLYLRAYENGSPAPILGDQAAVEVRVIHLVKTATVAHR